MTPVHMAPQGSVVLDHPVMPDGQVAGVTADMKDRSPEVWAQGLPRDVPLFGTRPLVQEPGKGPHKPKLDEATKRVKLIIPTGHEAGIVPVREFDPKFNWARAPNVLHDGGRVPVRWLLEMERKVSWERADQMDGREPLKELPGSFSDCRLVTNERAWGNGPTSPS